MPEDVGMREEAAGYRRDESEAQRLDRNYSELLQELRVAQAGVQILFGFLLTIAFQQRFESLAGYQINIYLTILISSALAVICFTAPVAAHRVVFRQGVKDNLVAFTAKAASAGLVFLIISVIGGVLLVVDLLLNLTASLIIIGGLLILVLLLWVVIPIRLRDRV